MNSTSHCFLVIIGIFAATPSFLANNLPLNPSVRHGSVEHLTSGSTMNINQQSARAIVNYESFSIGKSNTVNINMPDSYSSFLGRDVGEQASRIRGKLNSNGKVFLVNKNGIIFGRDSRVNVSELVASTLDLSDENFLKGNFEFQGNSGTIHSLGFITASAVTLLAEKVIHSGDIHSEQIHLGSGHNAVLKHDVGDGSITLDFNDLRVPEALTMHDGRINARKQNVHDDHESASVKLISSGSVHLGENASIYTTGKVSSTSKGGATYVAGKIDSTGGEVSIQSANELVIRDSLTAAGTISLNADESISISGSILSQSGEINIQSQENIGANSSITASEKISVIAGETLTVTAEIESNHSTVTLESGKDLVLDSEITANDRLFIDAKDAVNIFEPLTSKTDNVSINSDAEIFVNETISAAGDVIFNGVVHTGVTDFYYGVIGSYAGLTWEVGTNLFILPGISPEGENSTGENDNPFTLNFLPENPQVVHGNVEHQMEGVEMNINQSTLQAIVEYGSFDIGNINSVNVNMPNSSSSILMKDLSGNESEIFGTLTSNGKLFLINPSGIILGQSTGTDGNRRISQRSHIDVHKLIASTLDVSNDDFLQGRLIFNGTQGTIINDGKISAKSVALLGEKTANYGDIFSDQVVLGAGNNIKIEEGEGTVLTLDVGDSHAKEALILVRGGIRASPSGNDDHKINSITLASAGKVDIKDGASILANDTISIQASDSILLGGSLIAFNGEINIHSDSDIRNSLKPEFVIPIFSGRVDGSIPGDLSAVAMTSKTSLTSPIFESDLTRFSGEDARINFSAHQSINLEAKDQIAVSGRAHSSAAEVNVTSGGDIHLYGSFSDFGSLTSFLGSIDVDARNITVHHQVSAGDSINFNVSSAISDSETEILNSISDRSQFNNLTIYPLIEAINDVSFTSVGDATFFGSIKANDGAISVKTKGDVYSFEALHSAKEIFIDSTGFLNLFGEIRSPSSTVSLHAAGSVFLHRPVIAEGEVSVSSESTLTSLSEIQSHKGSINLDSKNEILLSNLVTANESISITGSESVQIRNNLVTKTGGVQVHSAEGNVSIQTPVSILRDIEISAAETLIVSGDLTSGQGSISLQSINNNVAINSSVSAPAGNIGVETGNHLNIYGSMTSPNGEISINSKGKTFINAPLISGDVIHFQTGVESKINTTSLRVGAILVNGPDGGIQLRDPAVTVETTRVQASGVLSLQTSGQLTSSDSLATITGPGSTISVIPITPIISVSAPSSSGTASGSLANGTISISGTDIQTSDALTIGNTSSFGSGFTLTGSTNVRTISTGAVRFLSPQTLNLPRLNFAEKNLTSLRSPRSKEKIADSGHHQFPRKTFSQNIQFDFVN